MSSPSSGAGAPRRRPDESTRARVLALLRSDDGPLAIAEVAGRLGLHGNSARFHLEHLAGSGLAVRETRRREGRGRPNVVYAAAPLPDFEPSGDDVAASDPGYRLLAEILAGHIESTSPQPAQAAAAAGRSWGRVLAGRSGGSAPRRRGRAGARHATGELVELMDDLGFAPRVDGPGGAVELYRCPFGQVAERHSAVVCGVHLGLMQGALAERGAPVEAIGLEPFVTPQMCRARLEARLDPRSRPEMPVAARPEPGGH